MSTAKQVVETMLRGLPDDCSLENIQYHCDCVGDHSRRGLFPFEVD
jgi:hypothetical protein